MATEAIFPDWWNWELMFTGHAELRMEQRGVSEVDVRAMLERAMTHEASVVAGTVHDSDRARAAAVDGDRRARF